jgi:hypothetical protein
MSTNSNDVIQKKRGRPAIGQDPVLSFRIPLISETPLMIGFNEQAIVFCRAADMTFPTRKKIFDSIPLVVSQAVASHRSNKNLADRARRAHAMPREVRMGKRGFYVGRGDALS